MAEGALSDLRILEFGAQVSAPYCTKMMGDMGAEVIKIEKPGCGDDARRLEPFADKQPGLERSGMFAYLNTSKLGITLNPETERGKAIFQDLVKSVDILVENNPPKVMEALGLTYPSLEKINPKLIMVSITPFGQTGPYRDYKAHDINSYSAGGFGFLSTATLQEPVANPLKAGGRQTEFGAGQVAANATMTAVFARDSSGVGQHIDLSIQEIIAGQAESSLQHWTYAENQIGGVSHPVMMPILPLECSDGHVFLMCVEEDQYDRLVELMGNPEWADNELFADRFMRADFIDALAPMLNEWSINIPKEEMFKMCQEKRIPLGPSYNAKEIMESEQLSLRDYFVEIDHPDIGPATYPGGPYKFSETPWKIRRRAPLLGEHNQEIFTGRLGISKEELERLAKDGVV